MTAQPLHLHEAEDYLGRVIAVLHTMSPERKGPLVAVLDFLLGHIQRTRSDLNALRTDAQQPPLSNTVDELEEIVRETASATNKIMDATEAIERIAAGVPAETRDALRVEATRIYEASAFQDITGQRIAKAVRSLQQMEDQIGALVRGCCDDAAPADACLPPDANDLMNGPQLAGRANSQDDIDRLLASLGA